MKRKTRKGKKIQEMEEKLQTYGHGTKLYLLEQLAITKTRDGEIVLLDQRPPPIITLIHYTTLPLGYQLWRVSDHFSQEKEKWKKEK